MGWSCLEEIFNKKNSYFEKYKIIAEHLFIIGLVLGLAPKFGIKHWGMDERLYLYTSILFLGARVFITGSLKEWIVAALALLTYGFGSGEIFYGVLIVLASKGIVPRRLARYMALGILSTAGIFLVVNFYLELYDFGSGRVNYLVYNPNTFMIYFMSGVVAYIHSRGYKNTHAESGIILAVSVFFLYTTGSRTGFMVIVIALALVEVVRSGMDKKQISKGIMCLIFLPMVFSFLGPLLFHDTAFDTFMTTARFTTWYHYMNFDFIGLLPNMGVSSSYLARHALDNAHLYLLMKWGGVIYLAFLGFFIEGVRRLYKDSNLEGLASVLLFSLGGLGEKVLVWPQMSLALYVLYSTFAGREKEPEPENRLGTYTLLGTLAIAAIAGSYGIGRTVSDYRGLDRMRRVHVSGNISLLMDYDSVIIMAPGDNSLRSLYLGRYPLEIDRYRISLGGKYSRITTLRIPIDNAKDLRMREGRNYRKIL